MDLTFSKDSVLSTTISLPSGDPVYELSTPSEKKYPTTIKRNDVEIGSVELRRACSINGKAYSPKSGVFSSDTTFTFSDGKKYTWKRDSWRGKVYLKDPHNETIATFNSSDPPVDPKATLSISNPELADEVIATFVYIEQRKRYSRFNKATDILAGGISAGPPGG
ncbi:hypothetical protein V5O48_018732, partial [Marasmius crinis-equi]